MLGLFGVTAMETSVAAVTVRVVEPETPPKVAVIVVDPTPTPIASPGLVIVALLTSDDVQLTCVDKSWVVLSVNVPVAVNCCVVPLAMLGFEGVIEIDTSVAGVTVKVVVPEILPEVAVMVVVPTATDVAFPFDPAALLIVATPVFEEIHVIREVISFVELSE